MNSLDRFEIIERVHLTADKYGSSNPQQLKQLIYILGQASEREVFFGLFSFFYDVSLQKNEFERQKLAGTLLITLSPKSPLKLDGSVYAAVSHWNQSIEELPCYLCKVFGSSEVISFLTDLIPHCDEKLTKSLKTMLFWSRAYEKQNT
jgi:hypothetical protein